MIVGCYSLDLYCDICWEDKATPYAQRAAFPANYTGPNRTAATKDAKRDGWKVRHAAKGRDGRAVCPICDKAGKK